MCINNTKAGIEALVGYETGFTPTLKYAVKKAGDISWKAHVKYHRKRDWTPYVELALGVYFTYAVYASISYGAWVAFPFMLLFQFGFLYMSALSLLQTRQRLAQSL